MDGTENYTSLNALKISSESFPAGTGDEPCCWEWKLVPVATISVKPAMICYLPWVFGRFYSRHYAIVYLTGNGPWPISTRGPLMIVMLCAGACSAWDFCVRPRSASTTWAGVCGILAVLICQGLIGTVVGQDKKGCEVAFYDSPGSLCSASRLIDNRWSCELIGINAIREDILALCKRCWKAKCYLCGRECPRVCCWRSVISAYSTTPNKTLPCLEPTVSDNRREIPWCCWLVTKFSIKGWTGLCLHAELDN